MRKKLIALCTATLLCLSLLVACNNGPIDASKAQKIALEAAGLTASQVSDIHTHIIEQNGAPCFQIHMTTEQGDLTIVIDAATGEVLSNG